MSLSKTSVGMAQIVGLQLANRRIELSAVNETPVQVLTELSTGELKLHESAKALAGTFERQDLAVSLLSGADAVMPGQSVSDHTEQMAESVQMLARAISSTLDLAQNTVNPAIDRVVKSTTAAIDEAMAKASNILEIVQDRPDPIFDSIYLQEAVARYANSVRDINLRGFGLPAGDIAARLTTGHAGMDEQLSEFIGRVGLDFATAVWNDTFGTPPARSTDLFARPSQANVAVLVFFYAAKVSVEIPEGLNIELSEWRAYTTGLMAAAGSAIVYGNDERDRRRKSGPMVMSCPRDPEPVGQIVVDGDKYAAWLGAGGSPELIFATAYGDKNFDPVKMLDNAPKLTEDWGKIFGMYQNKLAYVRFDAMISGLRAALTSEINALENDALKGSLGAYHDRLREMLPRVKQRGLEELWDTARKLVCRVIYPHTDAEALLLAIDEQAKIHGDKPVRELALYATIEIVARWLTDQMVAKYH